MVSHDESLVLGVLAEEFVQRVRSGERVDVEGYAALHPDLAVRIRALFPTLLLLEGMAGGAGAARGAPAAGELERGAVFGRYEIEEEVGRGGMGVVYKARHTELGRAVALKILSLARLESQDALERFLREASTTASLHHTGIVPVFDVGQVERVPYYAMAFIEGETLDRAKQRSCPSLRERCRRMADLGVQACAALGHAHQRGVIHRDVKPSNLILDAEGVLHLTDFGLALRGGDASLTVSGALVGTPRYMSPEQVSATTQVDERTDVYGLGVTLYEFVTGRAAFDAPTPEKVMSDILTREPPAPRRLLRDFPRDLETILLKAITKRREDRYQSADALGEDLQRWLQHRPILARRAGPLLRLVRWSQRNPALAVATSAAFGALTIGLIVTLVLLGRVRDERDAKEQNAVLARDQRDLALDAFVTLVHDLQLELEDVPGVAHLREGVLEDAIAGLSEVLRSEEAGARADRTVAEARRRLAEVLIDLGRLEAAHEQLDRARGALEELRLESGGDVVLMEELALVCRALGAVFLLEGSTERAGALLEEAIELQRSVHPEGADDPAVGLAIARNVASLADVRWREDRAEDSVTLFGEAIALVSPEECGLAGDTFLAETHAALALVHLHMNGDLDAARLELEHAHRHGEAARTERPRSPRVRRILADIHEQRALLAQREHALARAAEHAKSAMALRRALAQEDPTDVRALSDVAGAVLDAADVHWALGEAEEARALYLEGLARREALVELDATRASFKRDLGVVLARLGESRSAVVGLAEVREYAERAVEIFTELAALDPTNALAQDDLAIAAEKAGKACIDVDDMEAARPHLEVALAISAARSEGEAPSPEARHALSLSHYLLGELHRRSGEHDQARPHYDQAQELLEQVIAEEPANLTWRSHLISVWERRGLSGLESGDFAAGAASLSSALAALTDVEALLGEDRSPDFVPWRAYLTHFHEICRLAPEAIESLDAALRPADLSIRLELVLIRLGALSSEGDPPDFVQMELAIASLHDLSEQGPKVWVSIARGHAILIRTVRERGLEGERDVSDDIAEAVHWLTEAMDGAPDEAERFFHDPAFRVLADDPAYLKLGE